MDSSIKSEKNEGERKSQDITRKIKTDINNDINSTTVFEMNVVDSLIGTQDTVFG